MRRLVRLGWRLHAPAVAAAILVGCGGGGVNGVAVTGKVIDGYLNGAQVCLDVNDNKSCDANEPTTISGAGGAFKLNPPSNLDLATVRLIANVPATAIDEDTGTAVGTAYQMTAPANLAYVTPLTTLALSFKDQGGTWAQAIQSVKNGLGISDSQFKVDADYIAEANIKTHNVARLVAGVLQTNQIQGSTNVRSIVSGLSSFAGTAFNSSTAMSTADLTTLVTNGASAVRQRVFASSFQSGAGWIDDPHFVYKQGNTDVTGGIYGMNIEPSTDWWNHGMIDVVGSQTPNGANFYWGTWHPALLQSAYIESWVMVLGGFDISGMGKINVKAWTNPDLGNSPRFKVILESVAINGCVPTARSTTTLVAPAVDPNSYAIVNQSAAVHQLNLNSFNITQTCSGAVSSVADFKSRSLKTVRVRIEQDKLGSATFINLGPISFEP